MTRAALAVDLGGTELRAAIVEETGAVSAFAATATAAAAGPDAVIDQIVALVGRVATERPQIAPVGLGVGAPGPLDGEAGIAIAPPTLAGWRDVPLAARLEARLGLPVRIENDANAAALGEWRFGAGRGTRSVVFVTVSTGIGGGVIADGRLLRGHRGLAAEVGHMTIAAGRERCACGALGCWEALASGTALGREAARRVEAGEAPAIAARAAGGAPTARHVAEAARAGDPVAAGLLQAEAVWLGIGLVNLLHLYAPERLILGGGVGEALDLMRATIEATIAERAMVAYRDVPVVAAALGRNAGLVGAAGLVL
ncbi:ROK family protein [Prosthecomicrobium pneumaticum]|uniref:Glucokinase n=1 Tax=Prosthecomicrobium pneumaticum TaxID=81895 RepID=A0A7W9CTE1_9HYPH|nr:glucokinase [Prosthecomicrobium pneumaticum]